MLADPTVHKNLQVTYGDDSQTYVEFRKEAVQNGFKSENQGVPIFDDVDFIRIMFPGDRTKIIDRPVKEEDKYRFERQWNQYEKTGVVSHEGTPITEWPPLTKGEAMTLKGSGIHTVQQLAAMSDHGLDVILGAHQMREKAKIFVQAQTGDNAAISKLMAAVEQLTLDNKALKEQVSGLPPQVERKKPGRKPKVNPVQ